MAKARRKPRSYVVDAKGNISCLYYDGDRSLFRMMGRMVRAKKISDVRFSPDKQRWEAVDRKTRKVIAFDAARKRCVEKEHDFYERMIARGVIPWER